MSMEAFTSSKLFSYHILYNYIICQLGILHLSTVQSNFAVQKYITNLLEYLHGHFLTKMEKTGFLRACQKSLGSKE